MQVAPRCEHFGECGGCSFQNLAYAAQLREKERQARPQAPPQTVLIDRQALEGKAGYGPGAQILWSSDASRLWAHEMTLSHPRFSRVHCRGDANRCTTCTETRVGFRVTIPYPTLPYPTHHGVAERPGWPCCRSRRRCGASAAWTPLPRCGRLWPVRIPGATATR